MSKYTVSKLESIDKLSDNDLLLVSHDNGDGTYSSVNVPFSVIAESIGNSSDSVGSIGNGTTDTIGYFSPTTKAHVVESLFYDATTKSAILLKSGAHVYNYCSKAFIVFKKHSSSEETEYEYNTDIDEYKEIKYGLQIVGNLPLSIEQVSHTDTETGTTTDYLVAKDLHNTCNKYTRKNDLPEFIRSNITELTFSSGDVVHVEDALGQHTKLTCSTFNNSTNLYTNYKIANKQRDNFVSLGYNLIIEGEYSLIRPLYQVINDVSFSTYFIKPTNTDAKTATAKNTPVYTDELTINDDSAVYIFGSFTCDATSSKGESYYFEILICCENGDDDWFPIYRQYSTLPNANSRTTVNYLIFAKAGVKLRGYIAPQGSSNNVYYNLSNFSFTQCIVNGKFNNVEKFDIILIPYLNSAATSSIDVEPADSSIKGYWITIEGAFSRYGAYAGDKDNSNNLYFATALNTEQKDGDGELNKFTPLHTVVLSTKNEIYSTYKYFILCSSSVKSLLNIFASNKLGNNSNYSPYGSNSAKINYSESKSTLDELLTAYGLTDSGNCTILSFDPTKNTPTKKISGINTPYIARNFNDSYNPSARIGVAQINHSSTSELYVAWKRAGLSYEILENATGATSLYWMPLNLEKSGTTYLYDIASSATMKISNAINSFRVSDAKSNAQINSAKRLTSVSKFGTSITSLDDYCFFKCSNLVTVASSDKIVSIGESCFQGCTSLGGEINFPNVTSIETNAFNGCTSLTSIKMEKGVIDIVPSKFAYKCTHLTTVCMNNAHTIDENAFTGTGITAIVANNESGSRFGSVTTLNKYAFANCTSLVSVNLPSCISIGDYAFSKCTSLVSLSLPGGNKTIGKNAFSGCPLTLTINLGKVSSIGSGAFSAADKMNAVFEISNTEDLPTLTSINAFPNNAAKNTWKIKIPNDTVRAKVESHKVWRQLKNRVIAQ